MATCRLYDRAGVTTATAGTGTVTLGSAISNAYFSFAGAGVQDGDTVRYVIDDGTDFEIGEGVYTSAGTTLTRATVVRSNIAGVQGTTKLTLSGSATVRIDCSRADLIGATLFGQQYAGMVNGVITSSTSANALTLSVLTLAGNSPSLNDPVVFVFRHSTVTSGFYVVYRITAALSITISSSATLGHASARDQQIILYAIDNAGTVELAVATKLFDQSARRVSTTIMNSSATDPATMYSTTARTNVAWYPIARCVSNQTTAGTWAATPTQIDLAPFTLPTNIGRVYLNANQTGNTINSYTKINFDSVDYDADSIWDSTNKRFIPKVPGTYWAVCTCDNKMSLAYANTQAGAAAVSKNGTRVQGQTLSAYNATSGESFCQTAALIQVNGTSDYIEGMGGGLAASGTVDFLAGGSSSTTLSINRVGP